MLLDEDFSMALLVRVLTVELTDEHIPLKLKPKLDHWVLREKETAGKQKLQRIVVGFAGVRRCNAELIESPETS